MALMFFICIVAIYLGVLYWCHKLSRHFPFYIWGMVGFVAVAMSGMLLFKWYIPLAILEASHTILLANLSNLRMKIVGGIVLLVASPDSWVGLRIATECSTYIEACAFISLTMFYPSTQLKKRIALMLAGVVSLYCLNIVRLYIIVWIVSRHGEEAYIIGHGVIGRLFFFSMVILIYFGTFTNLTLQHIRRQLTHVS